MKKAIITLVGLLALVACSEDIYEEADQMNENTNETSTNPQNSVYTNTPAVGYESPFDITHLIDVPVRFINNTANYQIGYRVQVGPAYYDGNINGVIDYSPAGGPLLDITDAPNLLYAGNEFNPALFVQYILPIGSGTSVTHNFGSFTASSPLNALEVNFLQRYGKIYSVYNYIYHNSNPGTPVKTMFLKGDAPIPFTSSTSIPPAMISQGYDMVPGIQTYNPATNSLMGIVAYHQGSREVVYPPLT